MSGELNVCCVRLCFNIYIYIYIYIYISELYTDAVS
jgi:hypothetical protein